MNSEKYFEMLDEITQLKRDKNELELIVNNHKEKIKELQEELLLSEYDNEFYKFQNDELLKEIKQLKGEE